VKVKSASGDHGKKSESERTFVVNVASFKLVVISESEKSVSGDSCKLLGSEHTLVVIVACLRLVVKSVSGDRCKLLGRQVGDSTGLRLPH